MKNTMFDSTSKDKFNWARLDHLASLGLPLENRTVLEVGAGVGKLTGFFEERGCQVTSVDGRAGNCEENLRRHPWREGQVHCLDLERPDACEGLGDFDVVFCYGLLYHVPDPGALLEKLSSHCRDLFLLSTRVSSRDDGLVRTVRDSTRADEALHGRGCRPARDWVMAALRRLFGFAYTTVTQPDFPRDEFPLCWPSEQEYQRAVFVGSMEELDLPALTEELPAEQKAAHGAGPR